jgi:hypothetical protein
MPGVVWKNDEEFSVDGTSYVCVVGRGSTATADMRIVKPRWLIERYLRLFDELQPRRLIEIGIWGGGSMALFAQLLDPVKHVAMELRAEPVPALARFIDDRGLGDRVKPYYGVDQSDPDRLVEICDEAFGEPLDLVVDDASHLLGPATTTFNALFPRLRTGGVYVIEDWSWAQGRVAFSKEPLPERFAGQPPLSDLVTELVLASASSPDAVVEVRASLGFAAITRGPAELDRDSFTVSSLAGSTRT